MKGHTVSIIGLLVGAALIAGLAGIISAFAVARLMSQSRQSEDTAFPLAQAVESHACPKGLTRISLTRGVEDAFAPAVDEPAHIDPRLLRNGFFADLAEGKVSSIGLRAYDQGGADKTLIDHFIVPRGIVSGKLVLRIAEAAPGASNDGLRIGNLDTLANPGGDRGMMTFGVERLWTSAGPEAIGDGSSLVSIDLANLPTLSRAGGKKENFLEYLNRADRIADVDLMFGDDTKVDALALLACQLPPEAKGVSFSENRFKVLGKDVSWLSCTMDQSQHVCDPFAGDRLCREPGPVACYREGTKVAPQAVAELGIPPTSFVGGEVRLSDPVRGDRFAHLGDANAFCQQQFGREWRVLSYHEGGGGTVVSYSQIAPMTRALVNIRDQQYGNCWDRDLKR